MLRQKYKDYLLDILYAATYPNFVKWKVLAKAGRWADRQVWLNLGSGEMYVAGFVNIEADPLRRKDMWLDIRHGLPFRDSEVSLILGYHLLEHLDWENVTFILRECHRVLRPAGVLRVAVPSLERAVNAYCKEDHGFFPSEVTGRSIGRRFALYMTYFCQHQLMFDAEFLMEIIAEAGFGEVAECPYRESRFLSEDVVKRTDWDSEELELRSLFVEARK